MFLTLGALCSSSACGDDTGSEGVGGSTSTTSTASTTSTTTTSSASTGGGGQGGGEEELGYLPRYVVTSPSDDIFVAARVDPGGEMFGPVPGVAVERYAVAKLDTSLARAWVRVVEVDAPSPQGLTASTLLATSDGGVIYGASLEADARVGGTTLSKKGARDIVLMRFDADGELLWSTRTGGSGATVGILSLTLVGDTLIGAGYLDGTADFGGGAVGSVGSRFLAGWSASDGTHRFSRVVPTNRLSRVSGLDAGSFVATGRLTPGAVEVDGLSVGATDAAAVGVVFDADTGFATESWTYASGSGLIDAFNFPHRNLVGAGGMVFDLGVFNGGVIVGSDSLASAGGDDIFLAASNAAGTAWVHHPSGNGREIPGALCASPSGKIAYAGSVFDGTVSIGGLTLSSSGPEDGRSWLAAIDPDSGDVIGVADASSPRVFTDCAFLSDGRVVVVGLGGVRIFDLAL